MAAASTSFSSSLMYSVGASVAVPHSTLSLKRFGALLLFLFTHNWGVKQQSRRPTLPRAERPEVLERENGGTCNCLLYSATHSIRKTAPRGRAAKSGRKRK